MTPMSVAELEIEAKTWVPDLVLDSGVSHFLGVVCPLAKNLDMDSLCLFPPKDNIFKNLS